MSAGVLLGVGLLGGIGALARFLVDDAVSSRLGREFPYGTFAINVAGAAALGVLAGATVGADADRLAGTGAIGAFTTFSTWMFESHRLGEAGRLRMGLLNFVLSLVAGIGAAALGRHVGGLL